jgi:hypothetical protein
LEQRNLFWLDEFFLILSSHFAFARNDMLAEHKGMSRLEGDATMTIPYRPELEQLEDRVTPSFAVLQYSLNNFVSPPDPIAGLYRYNHASGFQSLLPSNIIADQTAINASGDVVGEFLSKGVWRYKDSTGWQQLTPTDADKLAIGPGGNVVGSFHGQGVWRFEDATGWRQLTNVDALHVGIGSNGIVAGTFQGRGVWRYEDVTGWQQLTTIDPDFYTEFSTAGPGIVVADFGAGSGLCRFEDATGWQQMTPPTETPDRLGHLPQTVTFRVNAAGNVAVAYTDGTFRFEDATGWQKLTPAYPQQLGLGDDNEVFFSAFGGTWRNSDDTGWQEIQTKAAILLGGEGSGSYVFFPDHAPGETHHTNPVFHGSASGSVAYSPGGGTYSVPVTSNYLTIAVNLSDMDPAATWGRIFVNVGLHQDPPHAGDTDFSGDYVGSTSWSGRASAITFDIHGKINIHVTIDLDTNSGTWTFDVGDAHGSGQMTFS